MAFILAGDTGVQGAAAAPPPAVETRVAGAPVATGAPFGGWRLVAQGTGTNSGNSGTIGAPSSVSTPASGSNGTISPTGTNGTTGTINPTGTNGTTGTSQAAPNYAPSGAAGVVPTPNGSSPATTTGTPAPSLESAPGSSGAGLSSPNPLPGTTSTLPSGPSSTPSAPASTSVPSYGGSTTR